MTLREMRKQANLTQKDVAARMGVSAVTINRYENGKRKVSGPNVEKLAAIYHMPLEVVYKAAYANQ